jgi:hypothetical protein
MKPDAPMVVFVVFATDLLDERDQAMMERHLGYVEGGMDPKAVEAAFSSAGLGIERVDEIGPGWREYAEERTKPVSRALPRLSRLRRQRDEIVSRHGQDVFDHIGASLHWEVFQFLGKLLPVAYLLPGRIAGRYGARHNRGAAVVIFL